MSSRTSVVETMVRGISRSIFVGDFAPGEKLPPYRELAKRYETTLPTAQRALGRVQELGMIEVRQGSGATVLDPVLHANPAVLPYWIDAMRDHPEHARVILSDFLELRRDLAVLVLIRVRQSLGTQAFSVVEDALDELAAVVQRDSRDLEAILEADLRVARALVGLRRSVAVSTVFNVFESVLRAVPELQQAMYATPAANLLAYRAVVGLLESEASDEEIARTVQRAARSVDEQTLREFQRRLEERR